MNPIQNRVWGKSKRFSISRGTYQYKRFKMFNSYMYTIEICVGFISHLFTLFSGLSCFPFGALAGMNERRGRKQHKKLYVASLSRYRSKLTARRQRCCHHNLDCRPCIIIMCEDCKVRNKTSIHISKNRQKYIRPRNGPEMNQKIRLDCKFVWR